MFFALSRIKEKKEEEGGSDEDSEEEEEEENEEQKPVLSAAPINHPLGAVNRIRVCEKLLQHCQHKECVSVIIS